MDAEIAQVGTSARLAELVDAYSRRVYPAVLAQHDRASVSSPLGIWLLLAACATGAQGENRTALEDVLGCTADEAGELLKAFMASPPRALQAAIAAWVKAVHADCPKLVEWARELPPSVQQGSMPTQHEADAWAERHTVGLIKQFPLEIDAETTVVLASALATKVSWGRPFEVVSADEHLGASSPWRGMAKRLLWDPRPRSFAMIAETRAAGLVAVHQAQAVEDLTVISVSAEPGLAREAVLGAAHEVAAYARNDERAPGRSLFELPLGAGHSWLLTEQQVRTFRSGECVERISGVSLPAWRIESKLDLESSQRFGSAPALETMGELIGGAGDRTAAEQVALASFTRYGFEAAAVTGFLTAASARRAPMETGLERTAVLRFDHPYAAMAIAGHPPRPMGPEATVGAQFTGLPVFTAWIQAPDEADEGPAPTAD
jgi:serine protease inhibitor